MRTFTCSHCGNPAHFENVTCVHCGAELGFLWPERELSTLEAAGERGLRCANRTLADCNWLVGRADTLCACCALTRTRPADDDLTGLEEFRTAEAGKRRLLFELGELGLPVEGAHERAGGLAFELLSSKRERVTTGHARGVITLDLAESDPVHSEMMREQLGEPYRTVLGHFRHEIGHYYQPLLVPEGSPRIEPMRALLGDERADYGAALERHYAQGPPANWAERHVSAYATMHPWEDWAETFAHVLHIRDAMQTATAYGLADADPGAPLRALLADWLPLSIALNAINRGIGRPDLYPFVLSAPVVDKLAFVDEVIRAYTFA
ncbi:MAG TPA: putative zinc-binding metallopeptidase [Thermoleophilaceae bacterium]